ncbi:uncharacterized protein SAPINGB_P001651 [Magnusiomyces paraingens]|uniref:Reverse transcriptase domain-containing protein n=1 Tax=Magnusiomyces paraingens TaxID=2606893 RepID=A0A5E8B709_9ASCO|nr:uncharacterized protein SAPINGB_P001651 [Saprochaete ingens]VVT47317.1 unnamed protein product [Saprochaete ingens]
MGVGEDKWKWVGKVLGPTDWFSLFLFTNRDMVTILVKDITIVNVYNQPKPSKKYPEPPVFEFLKREIKEQYSKIVIAGDYNLHHKEWESRAGPNTEADEVVEWLHENDMMLITPRNQKIYNNRTNIDLVYGSVDLLHRISFSGVDENTLSDHSIVEWDISMSQSKNGDEVFTSVKRLNIKNADWEKFDKELSSAIKDFNVHNKPLKSTDQIDDQAKVLEEVVKRAMAKSMNEVKVMKKFKRYWNQELREKLEKALEAKREARQRQPSLALKRQKIEEAKKARKIFDHSLREASTEQWNKYLSSLEGNDIWKILKYINPKSNDTIIPQIRKEDGTLTTTVDEKRHEIWKALLPEIDHGLDREFEIDDDSRWPKLEFDEVDSALGDTPNDKAPGDDGITGKVLKMAWLNKDLKERCFKLLQACVKFGYHPKVWRHGIIVVIPKPKKPDYSKPRAYRTYQFVSEREASMLMDRRKGSVQKISTGIPQGSPISPLLFLIYSTPMYHAIKEWGGTPFGFIDDVTITVEGKIEENTKSLSNILEKCCNWAKSRMTKIDLGDKLGFIHFTKNVKPKDEKVQLTLPNGELREPQKEVKLLGITLNNLLDFKSHILNKINKARKAVGAIWHLGVVQKGMRGSAVRSLYIACVRPIVEYGLEIWHHKVLKGEIHKLEVMQNMALRRIVGAYRTTPIAVLQKEAGIMPYSIRLKFMVARKAIRLHLNISKTNPINGHLLTLIEKSPIAKLTTLYMLAKDDRDYMIKKDEKRKCKRVEPLTLKQQQYQTIGILKKQAMEEWQEMYWNSSKDLWYHNITVESKCTDNLSKMVTGVIMKKDSRRNLGNITQFRTGHGNFGAWFKKFEIEKDSYNCKCGELETVHHILVECPLLEEERKELKRISPEMDMSTLLNSLTGLQEIVSFISAWRD